MLCQHERLTTSATASRVILGDGTVRKPIRIVAIVFVACEDCEAEWSCRIAMPPHPTQRKPGGD